MPGSHDATAGVQLAGYRIEHLLGSGGQADVFLARDLDLDRPVALKVLAPELASDERFRERFLRESQLAASLDHPNVIPIYEAGEADGHLFIAMRYVEGTDLRRILEADGALPPGRTMALLGPVCGALDAAHARGLVHRDVKPSNVLVAVEPSDGSEHVYLADFGLTRHSSEEGLDVRFAGSPHYAAPELAAGKPVDGRADVYALGCVLVECLTGAPPFEGRLMELLWAHLEEEPPAVAARAPGLPAAIDGVVERALAKNPDDRTPTCRALCDEARGALGLEERRLSRRALLLAGGAAAIAVAAGVAVPLTLTRSRNAGVAVPLPLTRDSLVRVDPVSGELLAAATLEAPPGRVAVGAGGVWIVSPDDALLFRVDSNATTVTDQADVSEVGRPTALGAGGGAVWLADPGDKLKPLGYRYDPATRILESFATGDHPPDFLVVAGGALWAGCDQIVRILPEGYRVTAIHDLPRSVLAAGEGALWAAGELPTGGPLVGQGTGLLWELDLASGAVVSETEVDPGVVSIAAGAGAVWVVRVTHESVVRVDRATYASSEAFRVRIPDAIAAGAGAVWVTSGRDGTLTRYDPATADLRTIDLGGSPTGLAVGDDSVWVAVRAA
jgi:serine/threonine-protein kinase